MPHDALRSGVGPGRVGLRIARSIALVACGLGPNPVDAACADFPGNVERELATLRGDAALVTAATTLRVTPASVTPGRAHRVQLAPQREVAFARPPARSGDGAHAGLLSLRVPAAGRYRVALDTRAWIDLESTDATPRASTSVGHAGARDCAGLRKYVDFELIEGREYRLVLSGAEAASLRLAILEVKREDREVESR